MLAKVHLLSHFGQPCVEQGDEGHLDGRKMEHVEFEPAHGHQSAVIEQDGVDIDVARRRCQHLPEIDERAGHEGIGGEGERIGVDAKRAEEGAHVGEAAAGVPVDGVHGRDHLIAVDGVPDIHEGGNDVGEVVAVGDALVEVVAPAEGAAGEIMHEVAGDKLDEVHVGLAVVAQQGYHHIDKVEHGDSTHDDAQDQRQVQVQLARVELHHDGRHHGDDDGSLHHVTELDDEQQGDERPEQVILLLDVVEGQDEDGDDHASEMGPDAVTAELLGKVLGTEEIESAGEGGVELEQEHSRYEEGYGDEHLGNALVIVFDGRDDGQFVMAHQGGEAEAGDGEQRQSEDPHVDTLVIEAHETEVACDGNGDEKYGDVGEHEGDERRVDGTPCPVLEIRQTRHLHEKYQDDGYLGQLIHLDSDMFTCDNIARRDEEPQDEGTNQNDGFLGRALLLQTQWRGEQTDIGLQRLGHLCLFALL